MNGSRRGVAFAALRLLLLITPELWLYEHATHFRNPIIRPGIVQLKLVCITALRLLPGTIVCDRPRLVEGKARSYITLRPA